MKTLKKIDAVLPVLSAGVAVGIGAFYDLVGVDMPITYYAIMGVGGFTGTAGYMLLRRGL